MNRFDLLHYSCWAIWATLALCVAVMTYITVQLPAPTPAMWLFCALDWALIAAMARLLWPYGEVTR